MARPRTDIQPRILEAAREEFLALGVDGASLRTIAKKAGTSLGMIYYYHPTKDELFLAVIEGPYQVFLDRLTEKLVGAAGAQRGPAQSVAGVAAPESDTFERRLARLYSVYSDLSELERSTLRLVAREMLGSRERLEKAVARFQRGHLPLLLELMQQGHAEGHVPAGLHPALLLGMVGAIGVVPQLLLEVVGPRFPFPIPPSNQVIETLSRALLGALDALSGSAGPPSASSAASSSSSSSSSRNKP